MSFAVSRRMGRIYPSIPIPRAGGKTQGERRQLLQKGGRAHKAVRKNQNFRTRRVIWRMFHTPTLPYGKTELKLMSSVFSVWGVLSDDGTIAFSGHYRPGAPQTCVTTGIWWGHNGGGCREDFD